MSHCPSTTAGARAGAKRTDSGALSRCCGSPKSVPPFRCWRPCLGQWRAAWGRARWPRVAVRGAWGAWRMPAELSAALASLAHGLGARAGAPRAWRMALALAPGLCDGGARCWESGARLRQSGAWRRNVCARLGTWRARLRGRREPLGECAWRRGSGARRRNLRAWLREARAGLGNIPRAFVTVPSALAQKKIRNRRGRSNRGELQPTRGANGARWTRADCKRE